MSKRQRAQLFVIAITCVFLVGCAGGALQRARYLDSTADIGGAIQAYSRVIKADSTRAEPFFERGYLRYRQGEFEFAFDDFRSARVRDSREPAYQLYFALAADTLNRIDSALSGYGNFLALHDKGDLANRTRARIAELTQRKLQSEIAAAIAREDTLTAVPAHTVVAVLAPDASAMPDRYRPLALALADFAATDLKQVKSLTVVERRRIDALERELKLAESGLVDPATAPRTGRLLGAGTLLGGRLSMLADSSLRYDGVAFSLSGATSALPETDKLHDFLELEKSVVFSFLDTLGIEITRAERDAIGKPPTESFLAVLAYAQGLEEERDGNFGAARTSYQRAAQLDPSFSAARTRETAAQSRTAGNGSVSAAAAAQVAQFQRQFQQPLLRRLTRFGLLPGNFDLPYTVPEGVLRSVIIEIRGGPQ